MRWARSSLAHLPDHAWRIRGEVKDSRKFAFAKRTGRQMQMRAHLARPVLRIHFYSNHITFTCYSAFSMLRTGHILGPARYRLHLHRYSHSAAPECSRFLCSWIDGKRSPPRHTNDHDRGTARSPNRHNRFGSCMRVSPARSSILLD